MEIFCLVIYNNKNFLTLINGNNIANLVQALGKNKELLNHLINQNNVVYDLFIFDEIDKLYTQITKDTILENWSKILIKPKYNSSYSNSNYDFLSSNLYKFSNEVDKKLIANYLNLNKENSEKNFLVTSYSDSNKYFLSNINNSLNVVFENKENLIDQNQILVFNDSSSFNFDLEEHSNKQFFVSKEDLNQSIDNSNGVQKENDWTKEDTICLLDICQQYSEELACFDVFSVLKSENDSFSFDEKIWDLIANEVQSYTHKLYTRSECKIKFLDSCSNYKNLVSNSQVQNTFIENSIHFKQFKKQIHNSKYSICKNHRKINPKVEHLELIKQIMIHSNEFKGLKHIAWRKVAMGLETEGIMLSSNYCQRLFFKFLKKYLDIIDNVPCSGICRSEWPYFELFQKMDLTPFYKSVNKQRHLHNLKLL